MVPHHERLPAWTEYAHAVLQPTLACEERVYSKLTHITSLSDKIEALLMLRFNRGDRG